MTSVDERLIKAAEKFRSAREAEDEVLTDYWGREVDLLLDQRLDEKLAEMTLTKTGG